MNSRHLTRALLATLLCCGLAAAQGNEIVVGPWVGLTVNNVGGPPCSPQDCTLYNFGLTNPTVSTVTVNVFGDTGQPFILAAAPTATQCTTLPGITNRLMLDNPILILAQGVMPPFNQPLICGGASTSPPGRFQLTVALPPNFLCTPGLQVVLQALVTFNSQLSFTCSVRVFC